MSTPTIQFYAFPDTVRRGEPSTLYMYVEGVKAFYLITPGKRDPRTGPSDQEVVRPDTTTDYTLEVHTHHGVEHHRVTVAVTQPAVKITDVVMWPPTIVAGEILNVSITIWNDTSMTIQTQGPQPETLYHEGDSFQSRGFVEEAHCYRVGLDFRGRVGHIDYPYRWGLGRTLAPGESVTTTGKIQLTTVKTDDCWVGLVKEAVKWEAYGQHQQRVTVTAPPPAGSIAGTVTNGADYVVKLSDGSGADFEAIVPVDESFRFDDVPAGSYTLRLLNPDGDEVDSVSVDIVAGGGGNHNFVVTTATGIIVGRVKNGAGYTVRLADATGGERDDSLSASGKFHFDDVPVGIYALQLLNAGGTVEDSATIEVEVDDVLFHDFSAPPPSGSIAGTVTNGMGYTVRLSDKAGTDFEAIVTAGETFRLDDVPVGMYTLQLLNHGGGSADATETEIVAGVPATYNFTVSVPAPATGVVVGRVKNGRGYTVRLADATGGEWDDSLSASGKFHFDDVPVGMYTLQLLNAGGTVEDSATIEVEVDDVLFHNFSAPLPSGSIVGTVTNGMGYTVRLSGKAGTDFEAIVTAGETFRLDDVPVGMYTLQLLNPNGDLTDSTEEEILAGVSTAYDYTVAPTRPESTGSIQGRARNTKGFTVRGYTVRLINVSQRFEKKLTTSGRFNFHDVPSGRHTLQLLKPNGETAATAIVEVPEGEIAKHNFEIE